ncbi:putative tyrosinase-like protein tyr-3 [Mya arenaria]|uniref:putative tyrosinase-like protein tyr-3 n=1 Tax=Mya arenaria TaxID=6604 RepID=UPI0022DEE0B6|nr:putative tyrosinase-like protein tyr-3 [Mya arenaria]
MASPHKSVIWSDCFVGNGNGSIRSSQFAGWYGGEYVHIKRSTSQSEGPCPPKLISKNDMKRMLHHCYFKNITTGGEPYFGNKDNLEVQHDGIHDWVGGDMGIIKISSFDPIFWMHHAFIDYIWEVFREKQSSSECNVDVETDYPETDLSQHKALGHAATDPLHGFEYLQIKDGLWKNWTKKFVNYEPQPQCPTCGDSQFMHCDLKIDKERHPNGVCVSEDYNACHSVQEVDKESYSVIERFDPEGFPGIGRTRGNADGENLKLLQQEIERETQGNKTSSIKRVMTAGRLSLLLTIISV